MIATKLWLSIKWEKKCIGFITVKVNIRVNNCGVHIGIAQITYECCR